MIFRLIVFVTALCALVVRADAHPHVWVTFHTWLVYNGQGELTGIRHEWAFDDMYSVFATQGLEPKDKTRFTREELAAVADENIASLKEYGYFTVVTVDGRTVGTADPRKGDYWLTFDDSILTLHFTVPLLKPVKAREIAVDIYDPTMFVSLEFDKTAPVALDGAPPGCRFALGFPRELTYAEGKALSDLPPDAKNTTLLFGEALANKIRVTCP